MVERSNESRRTREPAARRLLLPGILVLPLLLGGCERMYLVDKSDLARLSRLPLDERDKTCVAARRQDGTAVGLRGSRLYDKEALPDPSGLLLVPVDPGNHEVSLAQAMLTLGTLMVVPASYLLAQGLSGSYINDSGGVAFFAVAPTLMVAGNAHLAIGISYLITGMSRRSEALAPGCGEPLAR